MFRQIFDAVAAALATGEIAPGEQLPTIHALARELDVNPNTIVRAYRELEHAALVVSERGRGTFPVERAGPLVHKDGVLRKALGRMFRECEREGFSQAEVMLFLRREIR
ncbi:GntR family transcriptional regulator [Anaeromyxobacter diazotrophicus]|uniref:GntR family transcriptional regulator n=1 Tax=Anaeromyxobacter diazotrophicus TaxID=2590199 RepID=UPI0015901A79|nr:GntR family transcriptional regulator [Anaeromyxobacter diazotrophicus]